MFGYDVRVLVQPHTLTVCNIHWRLSLFLYFCQEDLHSVDHTGKADMDINEQFEYVQTSTILNCELKHT